jgi:hypothetical protein
VVLLLPILSSAYDANSVVCDAEQNYFCPPSTSCCPTFKSRKEPDVVVGYSCLMGWSSRYPRGPCCPHYDDDETTAENSDGSSWRGGTGCGNGYECASSSSSSSSLFDFASPLLRGRRNTHSLDMDTPICLINSTAHPVDYQGKPIKNKYESMPRYRACQSFSNDGIDVYGLPIPLSAALSYKNSSSVTNTNVEKNYLGQLPYYSNMGQIITSDDDRVNSDITTAVIGVHGSGRDAGTYLCALTAIVADASKHHSFLRGNKQKQRHLLPKDVLVVAPLFAAPTDDVPPTSYSTSLPYLKWDAQYPIFHTWRYGAESVPNPSNNNNITISSFGAMDVLLERLCNRNHFPNLQRIIVIGHSAGGQFVHRWALSSNSWCFGGGQFVHRWAPKADLPNVRVVAANPRSFTYLDDRRYLAVSDQSIAVIKDDKSPAENEGTLTPFNNYELRSPSAAETNECNGFNKYEWGLAPDEGVPAPYVINNVQKLIDHGDNTELFCRYASRDVIYLTGQRDIEPLGAENRYKGLHGDRFQGPTRRERSERYFASLQARGRELEFCGRIGEGATQVHDRRIVKNVAHDHALIFTSPEGIKAMFG